jgi:hypothetical protein
MYCGGFLFLNYYGWKNRSFYIGYGNRDKEDDLCLIYLCYAPCRTDLWPPRIGTSQASKRANLPTRDK